MADWDLRPERHPETGLPVQFFALDRPTHLALWTAAPQRVLSQSRYAALLVSLHGTGLYERFPPKTDDPAIVAAVQAYRDDQRALQRRLAGELGVGEEELRRNQALLAAWDGLSLALCQDRLPYTTDFERITVRPSARGAAVDPWPFAPQELEVRAEARRLDAAGYPDDAAMLDALERAPVLTLRMALHPA
jgi:hypothetical protein